jgi:hypothetical protein
MTAMRRAIYQRPILGLLGVLATLFCAATPSQARIDALLPYKETVSPTKQLPIDGIYKISSTGTRIRIEKGRGYALDEWTQLIFLIRKNMVTMQNIVRKEAGHYTGYDLPLLSDAALTLQGDGTLKVDVTTITGPASFVLTPQAVDDPNGFNTERVAAGHKGPRLKIPPVGMQQRLALGDTTRAQAPAQKAAQAKASTGPNPGFFKGSGAPKKASKRTVIAAKCAVVAGQDPDTGLKICDYPLPELNE